MASYVSALSVDCVPTVCGLHGHAVFTGAVALHCSRRTLCLPACLSLCLSLVSYSHMLPGGRPAFLATAAVRGYGPISHL